MEAEMNVQLDLFERISKAQINFSKSPKDRITITYLETRLESLEKLWDQFSSVHMSLVEGLTHAALAKTVYGTKGIYDKTDEIYMDYKCEIKTALSRLRSTNSSNQTLAEAKSSEQIRLPKISIPLFSGSYSQWISFRDLFTSLVHNNKHLDDVQKLHYLKGHLTGEAEQLLRHIPITADNYSACWELLTKRFNNKKYMSSCILKRFLSQRNINVESSSALKELLDTTNDCLYSLKNIGVDIRNWDILVIHILCLKLDSETRKQWEFKVSETSDEFPTFTQFQEFLETRFRALENLDPKFFKGNFSQRSALQNVSHTSKVHHVIAPSAPSCTYCSGTHKIMFCKAFAKMDIDSRRSFVQTNNLCFNCMVPGHAVFACRQTTRCRICQKKHHSLLHPKNQTGSTESNVENHSVDRRVVAYATTDAQTTSNDSFDETTNITTCFSTSHSQVLLATALVGIQSKAGTRVTVRCLLDQGSQASFITESTVQLLGLKKLSHKSAISVLGSDENAKVASKSLVQIKIQSLHDPNFAVDVNAFVLSKLTSVLPDKRILVELHSEFTNLNLADPTFDIPNKIDMLLGADIYGQILLDGMIKGPSGTPIAQRTALGWILSGPVNVNNSLLRHISVNHVQVNENDMLKRFWELENDNPVIDPKEFYTEEEKRCQDIYSTTTTRDSSGRYIVKLPFREPVPKCTDGNSEAIATKRFSFLEKRLENNLNLKEKYSEVIQEYVKLGHMVEIPDPETNKKNSCYLPHHAVIREDKSTSKLRVVFDASCKNNRGVSLNDSLMIGPTLQPDLRHLIMCWRRYPVCLVADIVKMYRQVLVDEKDADYQRILWRDNANEPLKHYKLLRVTFGTASAPFLAVRTLQQIAYDEGQDLQMAAERVLKHFYMDDLLTGCDTLEEGEQIYKEMNELLPRGGFELQKWSSNQEELIKLVTEGKKEIQGNVELKIDTVMKILGLTWNRSTDEFEYSVQLPELKFPVTKRKVISDISRLFDPLGWLAPVIISAKIFIQKLWLSGINWDDEVPTGLLNEWLRYRETLNQLTKFKLPRWINTSKSDETFELQGFCDASDDAYAAVIYARVVDCHGNVHVSLITSKTKVAPIKKVSIPRLELCGAVLLSKLLTEVAKVLNVEKKNIHAWTDSSIVLSWLNSHPNRWKTFVANRVTEIIVALEPSQWAHVLSKDNPADCASRGSHLLTEETLWKEGPSWLKQKVLNYTKLGIKDTQLEKRKSNKVCLIATCVNDGDVEEEVISKFSNLRRLIRVVAYCKRFIKRCKKETHPQWLTTQELSDSLSTCIIATQKKHFREEIKNLKENGLVNKNSKLTSLNPVVDVFGILKVGGRLQHAGLSEELKHPTILPQRSHFTDLVIAEAHEKTLHGGPQLMLNYLRSKYWVVGAKTLVKFYCRKCTKCLRYSPPVNQPFMGQLPSARATANRPFQQSGVDYAGPISLRTSKGRGHHSYKGYICLFVCMATRAIHLEAVSDMTSQGFLAAFKRFVARRGHCADLYSDNGTNFVGAARELKQLFANENSSLTKEIAEQLASDGTCWHFIPPHSPNFGGLWEAGIKSTKHHLRRVIGDTTLTFEEMTTMLTQIEACLNSRPLSQITDHKDDPMPLTPGHFLVGEPLILIPESNYLSCNLSSLKRWQLTQRIVQNFWHRWSREYLTQFYHRYKWSHQIPEPSIGNVVLIKEDYLPPAKWLYGLIVEKHPGLDGVTRVVSLKCKGNVIKRPVNKLCCLPIE